MQRISTPVLPYEGKNQIVRNGMKYCIDDIMSERIESDDSNNKEVEGRKVGTTGENKVTVFITDLKFKI